MVEEKQQLLLALTVMDIESKQKLFHTQKVDIDDKLIYLYKMLNSHEELFYFIVVSELRSVILMLVY